MSENKQLNPIAMKDVDNALMKAGVSMHPKSDKAVEEGFKILGLEMPEKSPLKGGGISRGTGHELVQLDVTHEAIEKEMKNKGAKNAQSPDSSSDNSDS